MVRNIIRTGNSLAITLPSDLLRRFGLTAGSPVIIEADDERGGILVIPASTSTTIDPEFDARLNDFINRYRSTLEELAER